jgi:tetratricopeptide (TPR) repeat protein
MPPKAPAKTEEPPATPAKQEPKILFHIEVPGARGLPQAETTLVKLEGIGIDGAVVSLPQDDAVQDPSGWLFPSFEAMMAAKDAEKDAVTDPKAKAKAKAKADPAQDLPVFPEPNPIFQFPRPCGSASNRAKLLDDLCCNPLRLTLMRAGDEPLPLGIATVDVQELIHASSCVDVSVPIAWSPELLAELQQASMEEAKLAAKASAEEKHEEREEYGTDAWNDELAAKYENEAVELAEANFKFSEPASGEVLVRVSTAGPIGRVFCPEDLDDWARVTVRIDGCYRIPEKLVNAGTAPPADKVGVVEEHPLRYSLRLLGLSLDGGELVMPQPPPTEEPEEGDAAAAEATPAEPKSTDRRPSIQASSMGTPAAFAAKVQLEEFVEGLQRAGFATASEDGPSVFHFLDSAQTGRVGPEEFARLESLGSVPAEPSSLLKLYHSLVEKQGTYACFANIDPGSGRLNLEAFRTVLEENGFSAPEEVNAVFASLETGSGFVTADNLNTLGVHKRIADLRIADKVKTWLMSLCGSSVNLIRQVDDTKAGSVSAQQWTQAMERLGYPDPAEAQTVFSLLDLNEAGTITHKDIASLQELNSEAIVKLLRRLPQYLTEGGFDELGDAEFCLEEFVEHSSGMNFGPSPPAPRWLFSLLDYSGSGLVRASSLSTLRTFCAAARRGRLAACKAFVVSVFGGVSQAFGPIFDVGATLFETAETSMPSIQWPNATASGYRGRGFLQALLNTLGDERGRNISASEGGLRRGGGWIHFFPCLKGQTSPVDFKDVDAGQAPLAKLSRWHHGQAFIGLRRLAATTAKEVSGRSSKDRGFPKASVDSEVEFRVFLSQAEVRDEVNDAGLPPAPFGEQRTYIKGVIKLDRPLARLCPRDIAPLPERRSEQGVSLPLVPPPPEKPPPPSTSEELEMEVKRIVGRLAVEFARMCKEQGWEEPQIVGPGDQIGAYGLLGRNAMRDHFLPWLEAQSGGCIYKDIAGQLRPAIVRLVKSECSDGPQCGLNGNEKDAMYSGMRDMIMVRLTRALNMDVEDNRRLRDAVMWRDPGDSSEKPENNDSLQRMVFEYELMGNLRRADELFQERLQLVENKENSEAWFDYARFLMRNGQQQLEAEKALSFAMSIRREGRTLKDVTFLAGILLNTKAPCSISHDHRFQAACSLLLDYADKHPKDRMALFILFLTYAMGSTRAKQHISAKGVVDVQAVTTHFAPGYKASVGELELAALAQECSDFTAKAAKYLELSRAPSEVFSGTLGGVPGDSEAKFQDFNDLLLRERLNRGEVVEPPPDRPGTPEGWRRDKPTCFEVPENVHKTPNPNDSLALDCIDLMLYLGVTNLIDFLMTEAIQSFDCLATETLASERCRLQMIRAAMIEESWDKGEMMVLQLLEESKCIPEAHVLLGECRFAALRKRTDPILSAAAHSKALEAFQAALEFDKVEGEVSTNDSDLVAHFRLATIYNLYAEESGFADEVSCNATMEHLKQSLLSAQTAEAWFRAGVCAYSQACLMRSRARAAGGDAAAGMAPATRATLSPDTLFGEAGRFLAAANSMDKRRPEINAWLAICEAELGHEAIVKQTIRHTVAFGERLDSATALKLARTLLRFSDESVAYAGERGKYVQDGRYAQEVAAVARLLLRPDAVGEAQVPKAQVGEAQYLMARVDEMLNKDVEAQKGYRSAIQLVKDSKESEALRDEIFARARSCAKRLIAEPMWKELLEEDIAAALAERPSSSPEMQRQATDKSLTGE